MPYISNRIRRSVTSESFSSASSLIFFSSKINFFFMFNFTRRIRSFLNILFIGLRFHFSKFSTFVITIFIFFRYLFFLLSYFIPFGSSSFVKTSAVTIMLLLFLSAPFRFRKCSTKNLNEKLFAP